MDIFVQICMALETLHANKIIHRDLKTHNLLMTEKSQVKLIDFGISQVLDSTEQSQDHDDLIGTPHYFAPEVIKGVRATFQVDIWSLGIVLYNLCTLKYPFDADCNVHLVQKITTKDYEPINSKLYSESMSSLVDSLLKKDPNERITLC